MDKILILLIFSAHWSYILFSMSEMFYGFTIEGEIVQNASGLGLHYINGIPEWSLTTNVNLFKTTVSVPLLNNILALLFN